MGIETKIPWTDSTVNFWQGCAKLTPACDNCYAAAYGHRFKIPWGERKPRKRVVHRLANLRKVVRRAQRNPRKVYRVFINSQSDTFDPDVPDEWLSEAFAAMCEAIAAAPNLRMLVLTKRIGLVRRRLLRIGLPADFFEREHGFYLGVTAEDQLRWRTNIRKLAQVPARVRFVSAEPLLEAVSLKGLPMEKIHWLIIGGESGARARPFDLQTAADLMREAKEQGVPVFMKQLGRKPVARDRRGRERVLQLVRKSGDDMAEWPRRFRVRKLPEPARHSVAPAGSTGRVGSSKK